MSKRRNASVIISIMGIFLSVWIASLCFNIATSNPLSSDGWLLHTQIVYRQIQATMDDAVEAESSERAFLITGDTKHLDRYYALLPRFDKDYKKLVDLTRDNPSQQELCSQLQSVLDKRFKKIEEKLVMRTNNDTEGMKKAVEQGSQLMDRARVIVTSMENEEDKLLVIRDAVSRKEYYALVVAMVLLMLREIAWCLRFYGGDDDGREDVQPSPEPDSVV